MHLHNKIFFVDAVTDGSRGVFALGVSIWQLGGEIGYLGCRLPDEGAGPVCKMKGIANRPATHESRSKLLAAFWKSYGQHRPVAVFGHRNLATLFALFERAAATANVQQPGVIHEIQTLLMLVEGIHGPTAAVTQENRVLAYLEGHGVSLPSGLQGGVPGDPLFNARCIGAAWFHALKKLT